MTRGGTLSRRARRRSRRSGKADARRCANALLGRAQVRVKLRASLQRSCGVRPVCFASRASIRGPICSD
jgi:hypothetical protein